MKVQIVKSNANKKRKEGIVQDTAQNAVQSAVQDVKGLHLVQVPIIIKKIRRQSGCSVCHQALKENKFKTIWLIIIQVPLL